MPMIPPCDLTGDLFDGTFDQPSTLPATTANEQAKQLKRVGGKIGEHVLEFCRLHVECEFYMDELTGFVKRSGHAAPDSAGRILRMLRQHGLVEYEVVNRAQSLYRIVRVAE